MDFDLILEHLGACGRFQLFVMLLAGMAQIFGGMQMVNPNQFLKPLVTDNRNLQRCYIPNCDNNSSKFLESFIHFVIPNVTDDDGVSAFSQCERYESIPGKTFCGEEAFNPNKTISCSSYVYDDSVFEETIISQFDIVCKKSKHGTLSQSGFMVGVLVGSAGFGMIADKFGRKNVMMCASMVMLASSIGTAFSPNLAIFSVLRFITAAAVSGLFQTGYILAVEFVGTPKRLICANVMQIVFAVGELVLGLVAYFVRKWKKLELLISIPAAVLLVYYWLLPESVRWLISKGKHSEAKKTILKAARWNKVTIPENLLRAAEYTNIEPEEEQFQQSTGPMSLVRTPQIRKWSLNIFMNWIINAMVYYGLSLSASNLSNNVYTNFAVLAAVEIPAVMLATVALTYLGRRYVLCAVMVFGGLACGSTVFIPPTLKWVSTMMAVLGKSAIAASFAIIYIYSAEIYPTMIRSTGIGISSMFARIGGIIAPFINESRKLYRPLPMIIFAISSIVAGVMALALPETHNRQLPETVEEAESFAFSRHDALRGLRARPLPRIGDASRSLDRVLEEERRLLIPT